MSTDARRTLAQQTSAIEAYQAQGVSRAGATQFLKGEPVGAARDRDRLATILAQALSPARQLRSSSSRRHPLAASLMALGVPDVDAQGFAVGDPVVSAGGRRRLAEIGFAVVTRPAGGTGIDWMQLTYSNKPVPK